jgi:hypothetical protein
MLLSNCHAAAAKISATAPRQARPSDAYAVRMDVWTGNCQIRHKLDWVLRKPCAHLTTTAASRQLNHLELNAAIGICDFFPVELAGISDAECIWLSSVRKLCHAATRRSCTQLQRTTDPRMPVEQPCGLIQESLFGDKRSLQVF